MRKFFRLIFLIVVCAPTSIFAGTYVLDHYSGGSSTSTGLGTRTVNYTGSTSWGGTISSGGVVVGPGTASCGYQIEAVLKWQESYSGEPTPPIAIVKEYSTATWRGDSGSCSNGLGSASVPTTYGATSDGVKWSVIQDPEDEIHVYCTPTASASISFGSPSGMIDAATSVTYQAVAYPVDVAISGTKSATDLTLLIGQRLTGTVTFPSALASGSNTYDWSVSAGVPFSSYTPGGPTDATSSSYTAWSSTNTSSTNVYFAKAEAATLEVEVYFATANLSCTISKEVQPEAPDWSQSSTMGTGQIVTGANPAVFGFADGIRLWGASGSYVDVNTNPVYVTTGIIFNAVVQTDPSYWVGDEDGGDYWWTQVITSLNRWYLDSTDVYHDNDGNFSGGSPRLDGTHPYLGYYVPCDNWTGVLPGVHDSPGIALDSGFMKEASAEDHFKTTLMFKPPGSDSLPVPLKLTDWWWRGDATLSGVTWTLSYHAEAKNDGGSYPSHPSWGQKASTGSWHIR